MPHHLHRTNINLNSADVEYLQRTYGYGWTEEVRRIVAEWVKHRRELREYISDKIDRENPGKGFP